MFTNGTLLTSNLADFFLDFPPYAIEISLYGIREKTYELITGTNSSYNLCRKAIDLLLEKKLPLRLKTMVMQQNLDEVKEIEQFAKSLNVEFRFDAALNSRMNADSSPCTMRIPPEEVVRLDLAEEKRVEEWKKFITQYQDSDLNDKLYICSAGLCAFHIDPYGHLSPCVMARTPSYELLRGSFKDAWFNFIPNKILSLKLPKDNPCRACQIRALCNQCPGWSQFEHADNQTPVDYLCEISQLRAKALLPQFKMEKLMALNS